MALTCRRERLDDSPRAPRRGRRGLLTLSPLLLALLLLPALEEQKLRADSRRDGRSLPPLKARDADLAQAGGGNPDQAVPQRVAQSSSDTSFQNDFLRVEAASAVRSKTKNRLTLSLVFQNISKQDVLLAMSADSHCCQARVIDNSGVVVPNSENLYGVLVTGLECILYDHNRIKAEHYARLSPGAKTPVVLAFESGEKEKFEGDLASFSAELLRLTGDTYSRFTAGLTDIKIQN
jgi:hypothetical protein